MKKTRRIVKVLRAKPTLEGAGVHLKRVFGWEHAPQLDPFLLLDEFHSNRPSDYINGFPWHPHRGIETITTMLEGKVEHGDSMGNAGVIGSGDVQWMTAGSGIVHQEMPKGDKDDRLWGLQLWANLPASHKMMHPRYRDVKRVDIPVVEMEGGVKVRIVCGRVEGTVGPVQDIVTDPEYLDVRISAKTAFTRTIAKGYTVFAYIIEGEGRFDPDEKPFGYPVGGRNYFDFQGKSLVGPETLVLFDGEGDVRISAGDASVRFLLISGKPIGEPVAWYGPIVMNTQDELRVAFEEYERGTFLKHKAV